MLKAGQTSITLEGANITFACPGTFSVKGSGHFLDGGASSRAELKRLPDSAVKLYDEAFILKNKVTGKLMANVNYRIKHTDGTYTHGTSDEQGRTHLVCSDKAEEVIIEVAA